MRGTHYSSSTSRKSSSSEARFLFLVPVSNSYEHFVVLSTSSRGRFPCFCIVNLPSIFCRILKPLSHNLVVIPLRFFAVPRWIVSSIVDLIWWNTDTYSCHHQSPIKLQSNRHRLAPASHHPNPHQCELLWSESSFITIQAGRLTKVALWP